MEGNETGPAGASPAAPASPAPRVLTTSLSHAFQAGESNGSDEKSAGFDDIFAPPETAPGPDDASEEASPAAAEPASPEPEEPAPATGIIEQLAAEFGLDPGNPKHKALLEKMAAENAPAQEQKGTEQPAAPAEDLDEEYGKLEGLVFAGEEAPPPPPQQQQVQQPAPPLPPGKFGDVLDSANTMQEAIEQWRDAWTPDEAGNVDTAKAGAVWNAFFIRQFAAMGVPVVHNIVRQTLQAELGDAIGYVRAHRESAHRQQLYAGVLSQLEKQNGYEKLGDLFQPLSNKRLKVRSGEVPDTQMNRIIRENPWILDIEKHHDNPDKALQRTHLARLQAVMRQWKKSEAALPVKDAQKLVESGAEIERKKQTGAALQRINAGPGATSAGAAKSEDDVWMEKVLSSRGGRTMSVRDLLSSK